MIFDKLENVDTYVSISGGLAKGLWLLQETDFSALEQGKYTVDGDELYFMVQNYQSRPENETAEAHRKYIDIQYMVSGEELIGIGGLSDMTEEVEANPEKDYWLYHGPMTKIRLNEGYFAVMFPQDAHAPGIAVNEPSPVKKIVVKVQIH